MNEWIDMRDRKSQETDADEYGCVIVWHLFQGCMVMGWRNARDGIYNTHWMPTMDAPKGAKKAHEDFEKRIMGSNYRGIQYKK